MLFVHHPCVWDIRRAPNVFYQMDSALLNEFKRRRIAIYVLHVPLDHFGHYSTSVTLARALRIERHRPFCEYRGALAGVFGTTSCKTVAHLRAACVAAVGYDVAVYAYGTPRIANGAVAVVAGGGLEQIVLDDMINHNVRVLITGVSARTAYAAPMHAYARKNGITVIGATHYSTEKFACEAMTAYFAAAGVPAVFVPGEPLMDDL